MMKLKMIMIGTIIFFSSLCGLASAQNFNSANGRALYPGTGEGNYIPPAGNYAILSWSMAPAINVSGVTHHVTSADIIPRYTIPPQSGISTSTYGWTYNNNIDDISQFYTIVDSSTLFVWSDIQVPTRYLNEIQSILVTKNLGTVRQRQALINSYNGLMTVSPPDFVSMLRPWIIAGIVIMIALPVGWFLARRFLRG